MDRILAAVFWSLTLTLASSERALDPLICEDVPDNQLVCSTDCQSIVECVNNIPTEVEDCFVESLNCYQTPTGALCSRISQCGGPIVCTEVGEFPDPDFCTVYHSCEEPITPLSMSTVHECDSLAYDITDNTCSLPVDSSVCTEDGPVPTCASLEQTGALERNPRYYYRCRMENVVLYPQLYLCGIGEVYDEGSDMCVSTTTSTSTPTETTTSQLPTEPTTTVSTTATTSVIPTEAPVI